MLGQPAQRGANVGVVGLEAVGPLAADGQRRFEALKGLRNDLRDGKPAYVVFDNKTLVAIARQAPASKSELSRISGIGPAKLAALRDLVTV